MERAVIPELLDSDAGTQAEIATALADLRHINRCFGGVATTRSMIESVFRRLDARSLSLLEVAAGSGYVPQTASQHLRRRGLQLQVTLLDRAPSHLPINRKNGAGNERRAVVGDALALPFADGSFDLVSSCLFAHHLQPQELIRFVNEGLRVCRSAVLINDLVRHRLHLIAVYAGMPLFRSRITRHDAPVSVRQAYTQREAREILEQTQAKGVEIRPHYLFRMGVIAWKRTI